MSKPTTIPEWATDDGTTLDPGDAMRATGFSPGRKLPAKWLNWLFAQQGAWLTYLRDLHTEAEFLNKTYAWLGSHTFSSDVTITGDDDTTLQVDADAVFNGALTVTVPEVELLGLYVANYLGVKNEIVYSDAKGTVTTRPRTEMISLAAGHNSGNVSGVTTAVLITVSPSGSYWYWPATSGQVSFPVRVPRDATLTSVRVGISNQSAVDASMSCTLLGKAVNKATPAGSSAVSLASNTVALVATASAVVSLVPPVAVVVNNATGEMTVVVNGQPDCRIHWVEVNYSDPGPRNG